MIPWLLLSCAAIISIFVALRMWWEREQEKRLTEYWKTQTQLAEEEIAYWVQLYSQIKRDTIRDGDWWKD